MNKFKGVEWAWKKIQSLQTKNRELEAQLAQVAELRDYCRKTISINSNATNIHFVADIEIRLQAIIKGEKL
jgi:hypothetical protein